MVNGFHVPPYFHTSYRLYNEDEGLSNIHDRGRSRKRVATTTVRFGPLMSSENVLALRNLAIPLNTIKNTSWATNAWIEWTEYVLQQGVDPEDVP